MERDLFMLIIIGLVLYFFMTQDISILLVSLILIYMLSKNII